EPEVPTLAEQVEIDIAQRRTERVRVLDFLDRARPFDTQQIGRAVGNEALEQASFGLLEPPERFTVRPAQHIDRFRAGQEGADDPSGLTIAWSENAERVGVQTTSEGIRIAWIEGRHVRGRTNIHGSLRACRSTRLLSRASPFSE